MRIQELELAAYGSRNQELAALFQRLETKEHFTLDAGNAKKIQVYYKGGS